MIAHRMINLPEQKYAGIKTIIQFSQHNQTDFLALQKNVLNADIQHIDYDANFMAMDGDFTETRFSYTPLIPVKCFEGNESFYHFERFAGDYYAFSVIQKECGPAWFKALWRYIKKENLAVAYQNCDFEYYQSDYAKRIYQKDFMFSEEVFEILIKKK